MCTRFVYNGIDKIVGFNFDIDLSVWDHTVITEENRFYIGIKMPDGLYHSFHGINKNGNVGTLLYVHGNENARYIESEDCITISEDKKWFFTCGRNLIFCSGSVNVNYCRSGNLSFGERKI